MTSTFASDVKPLNSMPLVQSPITWFEIPSADIERARRFYEAVLGQTLVDVSSAAEAAYMLPKQGGDVTGAVVKRPSMEPGPEGAVVYLRVHDTLNEVRARVEAGGGALLTDPLALPDVPGIFCVMRDSEGNHVGLHAQN